MMPKSYFHFIINIIIFITFNTINLSHSERKLTEEEWHHLKLGSDATQWALNNENDGQMDSESGHITNGAVEGLVETNVQSVDVGKDKLVLVNDRGTIKMLRAHQLPTAPKHRDATTTRPSHRIPFSSYFEVKGLLFSCNQKISLNSYLKTLIKIMGSKL
jgi:hypothetical protein